MKFLVLILMSVVAVSASATKPEVAVGKLVRHADFSSDFVTTRHIDVWLPEGYDPGRSYPVLYMHDGGALFDASTNWNNQAWDVDDVAQELINAGKIEPIIVVGVHNGGVTRHPDYFPQKPFEALSATYRHFLLEESKREGGHVIFSGEVQSDAYLRFLVEELKPFIDQTYSTRPGRADTAIMGSSMGGLISMYSICEYPEVFGKAACLSTHWPGIFTLEANPIPEAFIKYMEGQLPDPDTHRIYFDYGTVELDALYVGIQPMVDRVMVQRGYNQSNWTTRKFEGENHSEDAWNKRLHIPLIFLFGEE